MTPRLPYPHVGQGTPFGASSPPLDRTRRGSWLTAVAAYFDSSDYLAVAAVVVAVSCR